MRILRPEKVNRRRRFAGASLECGAAPGGAEGDPEKGPLFRIQPNPTRPNPSPHDLA